jgi:hypothetical protein
MLKKAVQATVPRSRNLNGNEVNKDKSVTISPQDREICSVGFLSYGYSAVVGRVPLFYFKGGFGL